MKRTQSQTIFSLPRPDHVSVGCTNDVSGCGPGLSCLIEIERRERRRTRDVCIPKPSKCMYLGGKSPNRRSYYCSNLYTYVSRVASLIGIVSLSAHSQTPTYYPDATGVLYSPSLSLSQPSPEKDHRQTNRVRTTISQSIIKSKSNHVHQHPLPQTHRPLSTSPSDPPIPLLPQSRPSPPTR